MTNAEHIDIEALSAFADGELNAVASQRVERHLAACDACRATMARLRSLIGAPALLPREVSPPPDAWDRIRGRVPGPESRVPRWRHNGWLVAAAAVVLVAGSALLTRGAMRNRAADDGADRMSAATPVSVISVDRRFEPTLAELRGVFESQRGALSPTTVRTLERSLAVIDTAIAEARAALAADPGSVALTRMLAGYYQTKVDFLKRATTIASSL